MKKISYFIFIMIIPLFLVGCLNNEDDKYYKIKYIVEDKEVTLMPITYKEDEVKDLPSYTKQGYEFLGWYLNSDFSGSKVTTTANFGNKDITLYAKLEPEKLKLILDFMGGEPLEYTNLFNQGDSYLLPTNVNKENEVFVGWYNNIDYEGESITEVLFEDKNIILFAKYSSTYEVTFDYGYDGIINTFIYNFDETISEPKIVDRSGFEFLGWYLDLNDLTSYDFAEIPTTNITLYAKWNFKELALDDYLLPYEKQPLTTSIELPLNYDGYEIVYTSNKPEILSNKGELKRDYEPQTVRLDVVFTKGLEIINRQYYIKTAGYKSLDIPIRSSYVYRSYGLIDQAYFDCLDLVYAGFALADINGIVGEEANFFGNVKPILKQAKENGVWVVMSVGPSSYWSSFSQTEASREAFANSVVQRINEFGFDGVDIDWETPTYSESDNFVSLMKVVYQKVKQNNPKHLVTAAITAGPYQPPKYKLKESGQYIDYINLMAYGMDSSSGRYQNALYDSNTPHNPTYGVGHSLSRVSIDKTIPILNDDGIPNNKIMAGLAFYGMKQTKTDGAWKSSGSIPYHDILVLLEMGGYTEYYDERSEVPYILKDDGTLFISYDNPKSITAKGNYVINNGLAGLMYWEHHHDNTRTLLKALDAVLKPEK